MNRYPLIPLLFCLPLALPMTACTDSSTPATPASGRIDQVAQAVARRSDRVSVDELAHWLIEDRQDLVLIDVRPPEDFASGHIEGARNLSVPELLSPAQLRTLPADRNIIVYSQGSETAAQAVVLLRMAGYNANLLLGGYNFWSRHVLNPDIHPTLADGEYERVPEEQAIACYFLGGNSAARAPAPVRKPRAPAFSPPLSQPVAPPPPATDEGC